MNNIQALKERIYTHNPELLELRFGCEVRISTIEGYGGSDVVNQHRKVTFEQCQLESLPIYLVGSYYGERGFIQPDRSRLLGRNDLIPNVYSLDGVIGHPIQLQHILKAIVNMLVLVDCAGNLYTLEMRLGELPRLSKCVARYDLKKSFEENMRNEDLLEFLLEVIN